MAPPLTLFDNIYQLQPGRLAIIDANLNCAIRDYENLL